MTGLRFRTRLTIAIISIGCVVNAVLSWFYMTTQGAIISTVINSITVVLWIELWKKLSKLLEGIADLELQIRATTEDILNQLKQ